MRSAVFPGQGNQFVGMGKDLHERFSFAKERYEIASEITGVDIANISHTGPSEKQKETRNTQSITYVLSTTLFDLLGAAFDTLAGHSIGEYAALYAAKVFSFEDGMKIVKKRGELMTQFNFDEPSLVAVIGVDKNEIRAFCKSIDNRIEMALLNAPGNYVVGGHPEMIKRYWDSIPGKKTKLSVSGPFHTSLYGGIAEEFRAYLKQFDFGNPEVDVFSNYRARPHNRETLIDNLVHQLWNPVQWELTIERMPSDIFFEIGPGQSLNKMIKRIKPDAETFTVSDVESLAKAKTLLNKV